MRTRLFHLSLALLGLVGGSPVCSAGSPLVFSPAEVQFGRMPQGATRHLQVTLLNPTDTAVRVLQIAADCGCTTSRLQEPLIPPGQSTTLTLSFESRHYLGAVSKRVHLVTSAGEDTLLVKAEVALYEDWDIAPAPLLVPPSLVGQEAQLQLSLHYRGRGAERRATAVATNQPWLRAELLASDTPSHQTVRVLKTTGGPAGTHTATLRIATDDPATPELALNLVVPVASSLRVAPSPIVLPRVAVGEEARATFRLLGWRDSIPPRITCDAGTIDDLGAVNGERAYELRLRPTRPGSLLCPVKIHRGDQLQLEVSAVLTTLP